jgi:hypothetical protein
VVEGQAVGEVAARRVAAEDDAPWVDVEVGLDRGDRVADEVLIGVGFQQSFARPPTARAM